MLRFAWVSTAAMAAFWTISPVVMPSATAQQLPADAAPPAIKQIATAPAQSPGDGVAAVAAAVPTVIEVPKLDIVVPLEPPKVEIPKIEPKLDAAIEKKPAFSLTADIAERLKRDRVSAGDREDRDAAAKFYDQRQGEPIWLTPTGFHVEAQALMREIAIADDWGLKTSDFKLPNSNLSANASAVDMADADVTLSLAALKYARHARGGRLDPAQLSKNFDRRPQVFAPDSVLAELARAAQPDAYLRSLHPSHPQFARLRQKYLAARAGQLVPEKAPEPVQDADPRNKRKQPVAVAAQPISSANLQKKLLANMEMWRWMPDLGDTYVQNNIPEFTTRMFRGGKLVHQERIVTGKTDTQNSDFLGRVADGRFPAVLECSGKYQMEGTAAAADAQRRRLGQGRPESRLQWSRGRSGDS